MDLVIKEDIGKKLIIIKNELVLLDSDVAVLYGVETRDINKAVTNNPDKFPDGYIIQLSKEEFETLRCNFSTTKLSKRRSIPKCFTEKGLYMLSTILKSKVATNATIHIIETFTKMREFSLGYKDIVTKLNEIEKTMKIDQQQLNYNTNRTDDAFELLKQILRDTQNTDKKLIGFRPNI